MSLARSPLFALLGAAFLASACDKPEAADTSSAEAANAQAPAPSSSRGPVTARGRIEPHDGLRRISGPADPVAVVGRLLVDEGDRVKAGQVLVELDALATRQAFAERARARVEAEEAALERLRADQALAESEERRQDQLHTDGVSALAERETAQRRREAAAAAVRGGQAQLALARAERLAADAQRDQAMVRAPIAGQVVKVYTRDGERVSADGILELAANDAMYAIAEVYETEVARVRTGQKATIRSAAFGSGLRGTVERVGLKVGKLDALGTDPAARTDARVVEVRIRLDDSGRAAGLTNHEVEILIETE
jgi:HlyD family secretion protein